MSFNQRLYFKILADAVIPLLGFFAWNWSVYFIFLFYILDLIAREVILHLKARKIIDFQKMPTSGYLEHSCFGLILAIGIVLLMHLVAWVLDPKIEFIQEISSFLTYTEMGIQQGFILIPLVALAAFMQYKADFVLPEMFRKMALQDLLKQHINSSLYLVLLGLFILAISFFVKNNQWLILIVIVLSQIIFQLFTNAKKNH
jgi:hypothetical protein